MSITEIAKKAGVSPSTVSRVLNHPEYRCSSPEVRTRIWKAAMEMNYVPNQAARALRKGSRRTDSEDRIFYVNVLITRHVRSQIDPFFAELLHVVESEAHNSNCVLSNIWYNSVFSDDRKCDGLNLEQYIENLEGDSDVTERDGLVIIGKCNERALQIFSRQYKGVISINRNSTNHVVDEVTCDGEKTAEMAIDYLCSLGHRNIAYVGSCFNESRYHGYQNALKKHQIELIPSFVTDTVPTESAGSRAVEHFLKMEERPTAIYCANDITAVGVLKYLKRHRQYYYNPSVIGSDDIEGAQFTVPMLTTIRLPKDEMGYLGIRILLDRLRGCHTSTIHLELEGKLIVRQSCASPSESMWCNYVI
ncbi:MAG: LacI family DNA-binding transcriptional regulator [Bilifractor sp.]